MNELSPNTKAILMLTAPLTIGRSARAEVLTPTEYSRLHSYLRSVQKEPADLTEHGVEDLLAECVHAINKPKINRKRLQSLLGRGGLLSLAVDSWRQRGIWVVSHMDEAYPTRFRDRLQSKAPPILYGCGDHALLDGGGLAVVGSRNVDEEILKYARNIGELAAAAKRTIVSGGARGVDRAAMNGALESGGQSIGILANDLKRAVTNRTHRDAILNKQLVLISPYDPSSRFIVWQAMGRNKLIYALSDAALVVNAEKGKGGTWDGAVEQLDKLRLAPVYIRSTGTPSEGLEALKQKGAEPWPNPGSVDDFQAIFEGNLSKISATQIPFYPEPKTTEMVAESKTLYEAEPVQAINQDSGTQNSTITLAEKLFQAVKSLILQIAQTPKTRDEIKTELGITQSQADEWLKRLVKEGDLEKRNRPVRYVAPPKKLFDEEDTPPKADT